MELPEGWFRRFGFLVPEWFCGAGGAYLNNKKGRIAMGRTTTRVSSALAAFLVGAAVVLGASTAHAFATYDGYAEFSLTLDSVTDTGGASVATGWTVDFEGSVVDEDAFTSGDATASKHAVVLGTGSMAVGDTIVQSSQAAGSATDGSADSFAFTEFFVDITNTSLIDLIFTFDYSAVVFAAVSGAHSDEAFTDVLLDVLDDDAILDVLLFATADTLFGPLSESDSDSGKAVFTLAPDETHSIVGSFLDTTGFADGTPVPVPGTLVLVSLGFLSVRLYRGQMTRC